MQEFSTHIPLHQYKKASAYTNNLLCSNQKQTEQCAHGSQPATATKALTDNLLLVLV